MGTADRRGVTGTATTLVASDGRLGVRFGAGAPAWADQPTTLPDATRWLQGRVGLLGTSGDDTVEPMTDENDETTARVTSSRRAALGKMAAVGGAAWVAPQIVSMPAAAAATCAPGTLDWDSFTTGATFTSATVNGVLVTLNTTTLAGTTILASNRTIRASPNGSFAQKALQFQQLPNAVGVGQVITFTFDAPVSNLSFTIYDIDNLFGGWGDRIEIIGAGYTSSIPGSFTPATPTGNVIGTGTAANLFRGSNTNANWDDNSNRGNVTISYAGPITLFGFRYTNAANTGGGNMRIGISDISWSC